MKFEEKTGIVKKVLRSENDGNIVSIAVKFDDGYPDWWVTVGVMHSEVKWEEIMQERTVKVNVLIATPDREHPDCFLLEIIG